MWITEAAEWVGAFLPEGDEARGWQTLGSVALAGLAWLWGRLTRRRDPPPGPPRPFVLEVTRQGQPDLTVRLDRG